MLAFLGELTRPLVEELAEYAGETLGWTKAQIKAEVSRSLDILAERHGVRL
jgi:glycerol-3-phosphate dehydrogenase